MDRISEAMRMLDAFVAVGADRFDVSRTTIEKVGCGFWWDQSVGQMRESLPCRVEASARAETNLIIRPHIATPAALLQLDDLPHHQLDRVRRLAFLVICTSPGRRQAWCVTEGCDFSFCNRVKRAVGSDTGANGWVRVAGTPNVKRQYAPNFPIVQVESVQCGPKVTSAQFREVGLVAPLPPPLVVPASTGQRPKGFPDYQRCLDDAPETAAGQRDRSLADFCWCCIAIRWGWSAEDAAARLVKEPLSKAYKRGESYAIYTARKASAAVSSASLRRNEDDDRKIDLA